MTTLKIEEFKAIPFTVENVQFLYLVMEKAYRRINEQNQKSFERSQRKYREIEKFHKEMNYQGRLSTFKKIGTAYEKLMYEGVVNEDAISYYIASDLSLTAGFNSLEEAAAVLSKYVRPIEAQYVVNGHIEDRFLKELRECLSLIFSEVLDEKAIDLLAHTLLTASPYSKGKMLKPKVLMEKLLKKEEEFHR